MEQSPHEIAEDVVKMAGHFARGSELYAKYIKKRADFFHQERQNYKSDNATEKAFDRTEDGVIMTELKMKLKSLTTQISAKKAYLKVLSDEAHNQM